MCPLKIKLHTHEKVKRCAACAGKLEPGETTFTVDFGTGVVVIRNVPATICEQCGMKWVDESQAEKIERIVQEAKAKHSVVEVMSLSV